MRVRLLGPALWALLLLWGAVGAASSGTGAHDAWTPLGAGHVEATPFAIGVPPGYDADVRDRSGGPDGPRRPVPRPVGAPGPSMPDASSGRSMLPTDPSVGLLGLSGSPANAPPRA